MKAYLFPGQGSQQVGMGRTLYDHHAYARHMFAKANQILDMDLTQIMLEGSAQTLQKTTVAQPAIFVHSVITAALLSSFHPTAVAGHSLGEISALVASRVLTFEDGLTLVAARSKAMQQACQLSSGTMVAVLGLTDKVVESICKEITQETVVPANYNCPGQVVISGNVPGINLAITALKNAGARKIIPLKVGGAFHSPLMQHAQKELSSILASIPFFKGICPIYQNITGKPATEPEIIKQQLLQQLTSPVHWTTTIKQMIQNGIREFIECGPGTVLQGLTRKIAPSIAALNSIHYAA